MWIKEQSDEMLPLLDTSNKGIIIERKNYKEIEMDGRIAFECDIRLISVEDFYREKQDDTETRMVTIEKTIDAIFGGV